MTLTTLTSKELSRIQKLVERKEALTQQIAEINNELETIESGAAKSASPTAAANGAASTRRGRGTPSKVAAGRTKVGKAGRGQLKERITSELQAAGKQGMRAKDLAAKLGTTNGNVTAFFQSTGKKIKEIKKVDRGLYAWTGA